MTDDRQEAIGKSILEIISDIESMRISIEKMGYMPISRKHMMSPSELYPNYLVNCAGFLTNALKEVAALYFELKDKE